MEKEFVTYEIALAVKELGFNENCLGFFEYGSMDEEWHLRTRYISKTDFEGKYILKAPLYQQLIDWFRYEKDIQICEFTDGYKLYSWKNENLITTISDGSSLENCRENAILKAIELCKTNYTVI